MNLFRAVYGDIYRLGIYTYRYGKRFLRRLISALKKPLSYLLAALFALYKAVDMYFFNTLHSVINDVRGLGSDAERAIGRERGAPTVENAGIYAKKAVHRYRSAFTYALDFLLPVAALLLLIFTVNHYSNMTYALEVSYNGEKLGCIRSESVLSSACDSAAEALNSAQNTTTASKINEGVSCSLVGVSKNELCSTEYLSDSLLNQCSEGYTGACAVYINNRLICAVERESDAVSAFDRLLNERKGANTNATISFVEDIVLEQCLIPEGSRFLRTAAELYDIISAVKTDAVTYTVKEGDTEEDILELFDNDSKLLLQLNPDTDKITVPGTVIVLSPAINSLSTKATFTNERTVSLPYSSVELETDELYSGDKQVAQEGSDGSGVITELVTYIDGVLSDSTEIKRSTLVNPVDEIVKIGTKANSSKPVGPYTVAVTNGIFIWPVVGLYTVYSWFGYRNSGYHRGIDISGSSASGSLIVAAQSGTVTAAGWNSGGYGYHVIIDHGNGISTHYAHCLADSIMVSEGDYVTTGQAIARVGNTGNSFGAHLHFEVLSNGTQVNPAPFLGLN